MKSKEWETLVSRLSDIDPLVLGRIKSDLIRIEDVIDSGVSNKDSYEYILLKLRVCTGYVEVDIEPSSVCARVIYLIRAVLPDEERRVLKEYQLG